MAFGEKYELKEWRSRRARLGVLCLRGKEAGHVTCGANGCRK